MNAETTLSSKPGSLHFLRGPALSVLTLFGRVLVLLVILLLALPVAILPIGSGVPFPVIILLGLGILGLVIWLIRSHWTLPAIGRTLIGMAVILLAATVASQLMAATPPITVLVQNQ